MLRCHTFSVHKIVAFLFLHTHISLCCYCRTGGSRVWRKLRGRLPHISRTRRDLLQERSREEPVTGGDRSEQSTSGQETEDEPRGRGGGLRFFFLKQCIQHIYTTQCIAPVPLHIRDSIVKLPTALLMDLYQTSDIDLQNNGISVTRLLHEIISQRTFEVPNASLYKQCCVSVICKCGFLTCEEISFCTRKMGSVVLNDFTNIFAHEHWCSIISTILAVREKNNV